MEYTEVLLQTLLAFTAIFLYARILGKQQVAQLTVFEYITGITFGSIAASLAVETGPGKTWFHFIGLTIFFLLTYMMGHFSLMSRPARKLIAGEPTVVIHNGRILENNLKNLQYNLDDLLMQLREKGFFDTSKVEFALLETNGSLSVLPKSQHRPTTPQDLQLPTEYEGLMSELVMDGEIIYQNLIQNDLDDTWLLEELRQAGIKDLNEVFFAGLTTDGSLHIDKVKDALGSRPTDITDVAQVPWKSRGKSK